MIFTIGIWFPPCGFSQLLALHKGVGPGPPDQLMQPSTSKILPAIKKNTSPFVAMLLFVACLCTLWALHPSVGPGPTDQLLKALMSKNLGNMKKHKSSYCC